MKMTENKRTQYTRLASLDALRGFTMFWIIGGGQIMRSLPSASDNALFRFLADQLEHVEWVGFHFYDLIFPLFLFIIGVTLPFSYLRRLEKEPKRNLYKHIIIRTFTLFILGLIFYGVEDPELKWLGYYGVLQLLAVGYFFASIIMLNTSPRGVTLWACGILMFYFAIMKFFPVPGFGAGDFSKEGNFSNYVSALVAQNIGIKWRILLSPYMIPTTSTALLGVLAGYWLRSDKSPWQKILGLLLGGAMLIPLSLLIALAMPVIKDLWSVSYVLLTAGVSAVLLALFYYCIDVAGFRKWAFFFVVIGMNPIVIYLLARFVDFNGIAIFLTYGFIQKCGRFQDLLLALNVALLQWLLVYYLYRQKVFIKI